MLVSVCLIWLCIAFESTQAQNNADSFCLGRNDSQRLNNMMIMINEIVEIKCARRNASAEGPRAIDCADLKARNVTQSGNYIIYPRSRVLNSSSLEVYCDMEDDGGGWTVIQRRGNYSNPENYFYKPWADYKSGFGNVAEDFWLGNDNIHALTNQRAYQLKFVLTDWDNITVNATYDNFFTENEARDYRFYVGGYSGSAGNSFSNRMGHPFGTHDRNAYRCARRGYGAWWYYGNYCTDANLNGNYWNATNNGRVIGGITWNSFRGLYYSLKDVVMKIRPM